MAAAAGREGKSRLVDGRRPATAFRLRRASPKESEMDSKTAVPQSRVVRGYTRTEEHLPYAEYIKSDAWKKKSAEVIERFGGVCGACLKRVAKTVHHLTYARLGRERREDLVALCWECHSTTHRSIGGRTFPRRGKVVAAEADGNREVFFEEGQRKQGGAAADYRVVSKVLGRLRKLGATELGREASVLKQLLKRHSADDIALALDGLQILFPGQPISLRMIHGKSMIGHYRGFQSAVNAAIKAQEKRP